MSAKKISTGELQQGMYVAQLDRPWMETPFLFQGFHIRDQNEITELQRHCEYVYVDYQRSDLQPEVQPRPDGERAEPQRGSLLGRLLRRRGPAPETQPAAQTEDRCSVEDELPRAENTLRRTHEIVREALSKLEAGRTLEIRILQEAVDPVVDSVLRNRDAATLLASIRQTDDYTYHHSVACAVWSVVFGRQLGLDRDTLAVVGLGGLLLDIGKIGLPKALLVKPDPLSEEERTTIRRHVDIGLEILEQTSGVDQRVVEMVATHHERHNGTGYPHGLKGSEIPTLGKLVGIVDAFVAMTSRRPYAEPKSTYDVMRHLNQLSDVEFQAEIVEQFIQAVGLFPVGTLIELSTGEVAVVVAQNRVRRLRPKVMLILDQEKRPYDSFQTVDLRDVTTDSSGQASLWITRGLKPGAYGIDPSEFFL